MAYQNSIKVEITTFGGYSTTADDATISGVGAVAWADLQSQKDLTIQTATGWDFIPFHAVDHAIVTMTRSEGEDPEDPTCVVATPEP